MEGALNEREFLRRILPCLLGSSPSAAIATLPSLHVAAMLRDVEAVRQLICAGADVKEKCVALGASALHFGAMNVHHGREMVDFLFAQGLALEAKDLLGLTAADYAIRSWNFELSAHIKSGGPILAATSKDISSALATEEGLEKDRELFAKFECPTRIFI